MIDVPGDALGSAAPAGLSPPQGPAAAPSTAASRRRAGARRARARRVPSRGLERPVPGRDAARGFICCGRMLAPADGPCEGLTDIHSDPRMNARRRVRQTQETARGRRAARDDTGRAPAYGRRRRRRAGPPRPARAARRAANFSRSPRAGPGGLDRSLTPRPGSGTGASGPAAGHSGGFGPASGLRGAAGRRGLSSSPRSDIAQGEVPCPNCGEPMLPGWGTTCGKCRPNLVARQDDVPVRRAGGLARPRRRCA